MQKVEAYHLLREKFYKLKARYAELDKLIDAASSEAESKALIKESFTVYDKMLKTKQKADSLAGH